MKLTFGVRNLAALTTVLGRTDVRFKQQVKLAVLESGERLQADVKARSPVKTGFMRDHVRLRFTRQAFGYDVGWLASDFGVTQKNATQQVAALSGKSKRRIRGVFETAFYPVMVIFGTRKMPARDFLTPAWLAEKPRFIEGIAKALRQAVAR